MSLVPGVNIFVRASLFGIVMFFVMLSFGGMCRFMGSMPVWSTFYLADMLMVSVFVMGLSRAMTYPTRLARPRQGFPRKNIDGCTWHFFSMIQRLSHGHL